MNREWKQVSDVRIPGLFFQGALHLSATANHLFLSGSTVSARNGSFVLSTSLVVYSY